MTWDPRDLGQPRRIAHPPAPPEPPAPPPRSYELRLADWDDRRLTAERAGLAFREHLPLSTHPEDESLCAAAVQQVLERDIFGLLYRKPGNAISRFEELKDCMVASVDRLCPPKPFWPADALAGGFKAVVAPPPDQGVFNVSPGRKAADVMHAPVGVEIKQNGETLGTVLGVERTMDGGARVHFRLGASKPINDTMMRYMKDAGYYKPVDHGDTSPAVMDANHRALVERPAQILRDRVDAIQYGIAAGATGGVCGIDWAAESDYRGADAD